MSLKKFFKKLLSTKEHPAHLPYHPAPLSQQLDAAVDSSSPNTINNDLSYTESETNIHTIAGTSIGFGTRKVIQVDSRGQAQDFSQSQSHILGTGRLVSNIKDIAGICPFCQIEVAEALQKNLITTQEAQIHCLYDSQSASQCDVCGVNTCSRHCRPIQMPDSLTQHLCTGCQKLLKSKILKQRIISLLLSPFFETNDPEE